MTPSKFDVRWAVLAAGVVLTWPMAIVRPLLFFVFRGPSYVVWQVLTFLGAIASLGAAGSVLGLCALGRRDGRSYLIAGAIWGYLIGAASFATIEVAKSSCDTAFCMAKLFGGVMVLGGLWGAPVAVPIGLLTGASVFLLGKLLGVVQPAWLAERPELRPLALVFVGAQALFGFGLSWLLP
jgi:hypothetical protein